MLRVGAVGRTGGGCEGRGGGGGYCAHASDPRPNVSWLATEA